MSLPELPESIKLPEFIEVKVGDVFQGNNNKVFTVTEVNNNEITFDEGHKMGKNGNPRSNSGFTVLKEQWDDWLNQKNITRKLGGKKPKTRKRKSIKRKVNKRSKTSRRR